MGEGYVDQMEIVNVCGVSANSQSYFVWVKIVKPVHASRQETVWWNFLDLLPKNQWLQYQ